MCLYCCVVDRQQGRHVKRLTSKERLSCSPTHTHTHTHTHHARVPCALYHTRAHTCRACEVEDGCTVNGKTYGGAGVALILPCEGAKFMCT